MSPLESVAVPLISPLNHPEGRLPTLLNSPLLTIFPMWVETPSPVSAAEVSLEKSNVPRSIRINGTFLRSALALASGSNVKIDRKTADFLIKLHI